MPESEYVGAKLRRCVRERASNDCEYCCSPGDYSPDSFTVDHIYPAHAGGKSVSENLAWSCFGCNSRKQGRTRAIDPETGLQNVLFNARSQTWDEHFEWSDDQVEMLGRDACGRATITALDLNRVGVVNLRRLLLSRGLHPPEKRYLGTEAKDNPKCDPL